MIFGFLAASDFQSWSSVPALRRSEICRDRLATLSRARLIEGKTENESFTQRNFPVWAKISHVTESKTSKG